LFKSINYTVTALVWVFVTCWFTFVHPQADWYIMAAGIISGLNIAVATNQWVTYYEEL
jgi:hypothetical protein